LGTHFSWCDPCPSRAFGDGTNTPNSPSVCRPAQASRKRTPISGANSQFAAFTRLERFTLCTHIHHVKHKYKVGFVRWVEARPRSNNIKPIGSHLDRIQIRKRIARPTRFLILLLLLLLLLILLFSRSTYGGSERPDSVTRGRFPTRLPL
jgi:hypothetical protein